MISDDRNVENEIGGTNDIESKTVVVGEYNSESNSHPDSKEINSSIASHSAVNQSAMSPPIHDIVIGSDDLKITSSAVDENGVEPSNLFMDVQAHQYLSGNFSPQF